MYYKELYLFEEDRSIQSVIRNYRKDDFEELSRIQRERFPPPFPSELLWSERQLSNHIDLFPEGALCVEINGKLAGSMTGLMIDFDPRNHQHHTWEEITDCGYIRNHNPKGNTLYVVDISIRPNFRKLGLGKWLMQSMYEVVVHKGLERLLGGGRMPGFQKVADQMTAEQYLKKVIAGELRDPVITFLMRCGRNPLALVPNYLEDEESLNYATLMEWKNPFHKKSRE